MARKSRTIKISFSNKTFYTLVAILALVILAGVVYANLQAAPNPGHPVSELQKCSEGEILKMVSGSWDCVAGTSGMSVIFGSGDCSGNFNIPSNGNYLLLASSNRYFGDTSTNAYLNIDGVALETIQVGDYVASGGEGGAPDQATFFNTKNLNAGTHRFSLTLENGWTPSECRLIVVGPY